MSLTHTIYFLITCVAVVAFAWFMDFYVESRSLRKNSQKADQPIVNLRDNFVNDIHDYQNKSHNEKVNDLIAFVERSRKSQTDQSTDGDNFPLFDDVELKNTSASPMPPYIDSEGNMHARDGQIETPYGILYEHPLTGRAMLMDKNGIEHDVLYEIHDCEYVWQAVATQGGGAFATPPLKRSDAVEYVCNRGNVKIIYVDDNIKTIMYKA